VSLAARALALTTSALIEDAIIFFFLVFRLKAPSQQSDGEKSRGFITCACGLESTAACDLGQAAPIGMLLGKALEL
jgi:hypothetical protein